jgi:hypothetical protein
LPAHGQRFRADDADWRAQIVSPDAQANRAAGGFQLVNCLLNRERALIMRVRGYTDAAFATAFTTEIRRPQMPAIARRIREHHHRQAAIVMMNTPRRRLYEFFDRRVRRARGETPEITDSINSRIRRVEGDLDAVFQND